MLKIHKACETEIILWILFANERDNDDWRLKHALKNFKFLKKFVVKNIVHSKSMPKTFKIYLISYMEKVCNQSRKI